MSNITHLRSAVLYIISWGLDLDCAISSSFTFYWKQYGT